MAVINTTLRGYATFIEAMRATEFRTAFVAVYNLDVEAEEQTGNGAGHYTRFHYTKQQGDVPNLYLRRISNSTTPDGDPRCGATPER